MLIRQFAHPDIPIYAAAVRPWMLRMCGEVADGVHVHPFHSRRYLDDGTKVGLPERYEGNWLRIDTVKLFGMEKRG